MKGIYNMKRLSQALTPLVVLALIIIASSAAHAQATRTWVSGVGDDANPCSRTAPCKTFAGAISKTAIGGEIDVIDPGAYGAVTVTKSMTIDGGYMFAGILASTGSAIVVNITQPLANDPERRVTLRRLTISGTGSPAAGVGASTGLRGVNFIAGQYLAVENCLIHNFTQEGILVGLAATGALLSVKDTNIDNCPTGISLTTSTGYVGAMIDNTRIERGANGIIVRDRAYINVRNSTIQTNTSAGISVQAPSNAAGLNIENTYLVADNVGIAAGGPGTVVDLSNVSILNNATGITSGGATINSHQNNRIANNTSAGVAPTLVGQQ